MIVFDGVNSERMVTEDVLLGNKILAMYKITKTFNGPWFLSFPISNDQTIGYFLTATFKK